MVEYLDAVIAVTTTGTTSPAPTFWAMHRRRSPALSKPRIHDEPNLSGRCARFVACGTNNDCAEDKASPSGADTVSIITSDDLCLVADHYRGDEGAPAVVLLHMTPTAWDPPGWSVDFQRRLYGLGWSVLNLDRQGAGDSEGGVRDAFEGPGGALDVQAAFDYLGAEGVSGPSPL